MCQTFQASVLSNMSISIPFFSRANPVALLRSFRPQISTQARAQETSRRGFRFSSTPSLDANRRTEFRCGERNTTWESSESRNDRQRCDGWKKLRTEACDNTRQLKTSALQGAERGASSRVKMGSNPFGAAAGSGKSDGEISFRVKEGLKLVLRRGDITGWHIDGETDAIVNAANERMLGGGGVDGAIHRKAGKQLVEACSKFPEVSRHVRCPCGEARLTSGFRLPARWVIHTVGPIYDEHPEEESAQLLSMAYRKCLEAAVVVGAQYVAFPALSCGIYGYPFDEAAKVSLQAVEETPKGVSEVHFVLFNDETYDAYSKEAESRFKRE